MKYMGSKRLLAKELLPIIDGYLASDAIKAYVEPFVGGCNMIDKVDYPVRYGNDNNKYLIAMLSALGAVRDEMPDEMPREEYEAVRADYNAGGKDYTDWYTGAVGFLASRSGRFFDGGFSGIFTDKDGKTRNYYLEAKRNLLAQAPKLEGIRFGWGDYRNTCSDWKDALIYCDPPYKGVKTYSTSRGFDHAAFWDWCHKMSQENVVLVSEQSAPDEPWIECVWEQDVKRAINHSGTKEATEKLYIVKGNFWRRHFAEQAEAVIPDVRDHLWGVLVETDEGERSLAEVTTADFSRAPVMTNWDKHRDGILERCAQGMCFDCLARRTCERLCRERSIDVTLTKPPCAEAWRAWAAEPCAAGAT